MKYKTEVDDAAAASQGQREPLLSSSPPSTKQNAVTSSQHSDDFHHNDAESQGSLQDQTSSSMETSFFTHLLNLRSPATSSSLRLTTTTTTHHEYDETDHDEDDHDEDDHHGDDAAVVHVPSWLQCWCNYLRMSRRVVLVVLFLVVWPLGWFSYHDFQHHTDSTFHLVPGSPSAAAQVAFEHAYPNDWATPQHPPVVILMTSRTNASLIHDKHTADAARVYLNTLNATLQTTCWKDYKLRHHACLPHPWLRLTTYFELAEHEALPELAKVLTARDGVVMVSELQYLFPFANDERAQRALLQQLLHVLDTFVAADKPHPNSTTLPFTTQITGLPLFQRDLKAATKQDLRRMDAVVLPVALTLVGLVLPNARVLVVWVIPLLTLLTTVATWSLLLAPLARSTQITQFTPTLMMSLTLGMGIDYTLFLLARYLEHPPHSPAARDEARSSAGRRGRTKVAAVSHMLYQGGHVLLLSGLTLMGTFLGLLGLPLAMLTSIGTGAAVAIGSALLVNLTLVPVLLFTPLGDWIVVSSPTLPSEPPPAPSAALHESLVIHADDATVPRSGSSVALASSTRVAAEPSSWWHWLARHLLHPYKSIIVLLIVSQVLLPVAQYSWSLKSSLAFDLVLPSTSPSLATYHDLANDFGPGRLNPFRILFDGHTEKRKIASDVGFHVMHKVVDELLALDADDGSRTVPMADAIHDSRGIEARRDTMHGTDEESGTPSFVETHNASMVSARPARTLSFTGIAVVHNARVPYAMYSASRFCAKSLAHCPVELMRVVNKIDETTTTADQLATYVSATLSIDPFSDDGLNWLEQARHTLLRMQSKGDLQGIEVHIEGSAGTATDSVHAVYRAFPHMIAMTSLIVFVLMGLFFKSVLTPLRSVVSITLTVSFAYGLTVLVFQHGYLQWTRLSMFAGDAEDEICWLVPIMAFSVIVGLTLDYDVFLVSRILEYRLAGFEHKSAIAAAMHSTGPIITAAGVIMAIAFGSLMLSSNPALYQWSFMITAAVVLDTFVVESVVVPAITGLSGTLCWWPRRPPESHVYFSAYREWQRRQE